MNLKDYLSENKISITNFAKQIGFCKSHISQIVNNKTRPSLALAVKIQEITKNQVQPNNFYNLNRK